MKTKYDVYNHKYKAEDVKKRINSLDRVHAGFSYANSRTFQGLK